MAGKGRAVGGARRRLVIVESPAKARTVQGFLGPEYEVEASIGHVRDLPNSAAEVPAKYKGLPWAKLGVDVDHDFAPVYVINPSKRAKVSELRSKLAKADEVLLATDEDREGEAIAWHLLEVLKPKVPVRRMVFHEITREAIERAAESTRELDRDLVDAQETRRVLDRLYGYEVSPVLWKKVMQRLSAGRVQSVALRLVVDRERQRMEFTSASFWSVDAVMDPGAFPARLATVDGRRVARGDDFGSDGLLRKVESYVLDESSARSLSDALCGRTLQVESVDEKPSVRRPPAPFITSTLQQEASRKLRWGAQRTMRVAQGLYERGFITYMRTDSTTLSESAITAARTQASELYGADHVAAGPRRYQRKVKNAQEAHEAIRPAGEAFRVPGDVAGELAGDDLALYDLIWKRTVASQMSDARVNTTTIHMSGDAANGRRVTFLASGTVVVFAGFLAAYEEGSDEDEARDGDRSRSSGQKRLPFVRVGDALAVASVEAEGHATKPPARFTEASLVKRLEERGIGRPSTYASIMGTLVDRGYVSKRGSALVPSWLAFAVVRLLEQHFTRLVDYDFTAAMEETLDTIASGDAGRVEVLRDFYFGGDQSGDAAFAGLARMVADLGDIDARRINSFPVGDTGIVLRVGRYGPYVEAEGARANVPEDLAPDEMTPDKARELISAPATDRPLGTDPATGTEIVARSGRYGPYVTEILPEEAGVGATSTVARTPGEGRGTPVVPGRGGKAKRAGKPRTASLFKDMSLDSVTLDDALRLLSLPRTVGAHPTDGEPIVARNGRYGPYVSCGKESRSLPDEASLFTVTVEEAVALLAAPRQRGGIQAAPAVEVGIDPATNRPILLKAGRFGPYVTDGEINASLRRADDPEALTLERATELLAERRTAGPPKKKTARKRPGAKS